MTILFSADWHLKLGQKNVPREWALNRYYDFFNQVYAIECDMHIIGGDIFDRLPSMEELELFFSFVAKVQVPTIIYSGNHEATRKGQTFFSHLKSVVTSLNPKVTVLNCSQLYPEFGILDYTDLHKKDCIKLFDHSKPLFTHVRAEILPHVKPEVDLCIFQDFPVVFAGDLHSHTNTQRNIVYPGSPMTTSFHRKEVKTGYLLIDEKTWEWHWEEFNLPQLLRKTVQDPEDMLPSEYHHTIYELEGNIQELASVQNSDLLDKKVVKRKSESALVLDKNMTLVEELNEYLLYILELDEANVQNILGTFNDYFKNAQVE